MKYFLGAYVPERCHGWLSRYIHILKIDVIKYSMKDWYDTHSLGFNAAID